MRAVIAAGGRGSRLSALLPETPKALAPICGTTLIEREIAQLKAAGITEIAITTGYLADAVESRLGDGSAYGVSLRYAREQSPLGSGGALAYLKDWVSDDFLMLMCDVAFDIDLARFARFHEENGALASIFVHPNSHPYDSDLVETDSRSRVTRWLSKKEPRPYAYHNLVNAGLYILSKELLCGLKEGGRYDLEKDIIMPATANGGVCAYRSCEYVKDAGTPERLAAVEAEIALGMAAARNLKNRQRCVFLDRDGTINAERGFISRAEDIELIPRAAEAIALINASGYLAVVITNQPVIARGECTEAELGQIHARLETLLGERGAYIDDLYYCPHHPDCGFEGEVRALKIDCDCRKPKTGMVEAAARRWNIDLARSWFVGDTRRDILTGKNARCRTGLVLTGMGVADSSFDAEPDITCGDLYDCVTKLLAT